MGAKAAALQQHAAKLAAAIRNPASQASAGGAAGSGPDRAGRDDIVDAEFTEIDDDKKSK